MKRNYLNCRYEDGQEAKSLGAWWDADAKRWYIPDEVNPAPFAKWLLVDKPADGDRWLCAHVDRGQRCANLGTLTESTQASADTKWYCHQHFRQFQYKQGQHTISHIAKDVFAKFKSPAPPPDVDYEALEERLAIQQESRGEL